MKPDLYDIAKVHSDKFYLDDELVDKVTRGLVVKHGPLLQVFKRDELFAYLLGKFRLARGARVLDVGCGVGAVAQGMLDLRPDLVFGLLNRSQKQLDMTPDIGTKFCMDIHTLPDGYDVAMVCYALGHADLYRFAEECAAKVERVCIYDLTAPKPNMSFVSGLGYVPWSVYAITDAFISAGFELGSLSVGTDPVPAWFAEMAPDVSFDGVRSVTAVFKK